MAAAASKGFGVTYSELQSGERGFELFKQVLKHRFEQKMYTAEEAELPKHKRPVQRQGKWRSLDLCRGKISSDYLNKLLKRRHLLIMLVEPADPDIIHSTDDLVNFKSASYKKLNDTQTERLERRASEVVAFAIVSLVDDHEDKKKTKKKKAKTSVLDRSIWWVEVICASDDAPAGTGKTMMQRIFTLAEQQQEPKVNALKLAGVTYNIVFYHKLGFVNSTTCTEDKRLAKYWQGKDSLNTRKFADETEALKDARYVSFLNTLLKLGTGNTWEGKRCTQIEQCPSAAENPDCISCAETGYIMTQCLHRRPIDLDVKTAPHVPPLLPPPPPPPSTVVEPVSVEPALIGPRFDDSIRVLLLCTGRKWSGPSPMAQLQSSGFLSSSSSSSSESSKPYQTTFQIWGPATVETFVRRLLQDRKLDTSRPVEIFTLDMDVNANPDIVYELGKGGTEIKPRHKMTLAARKKEVNPRWVGAFDVALDAVCSFGLERPESSLNENTLKDIRLFLKPGGLYVLPKYDARLKTLRLRSVKELESYPILYRPKSGKCWPLAKFFKHQYLDQDPSTVTTCGVASTVTQSSVKYGLAVTSFGGFKVDQHKESDAVYDATRQQPS